MVICTVSAQWWNIVVLCISTVHSVTVPQCPSMNQLIAVTGLSIQARTNLQTDHSWLCQIIRVISHYQRHPGETVLQ